MRRAFRNGTPCDIFVLPGKPAPTLIIHRTAAPGDEDSAAVYARDPSGASAPSGTLTNSALPRVIAALRRRQGCVGAPRMWTT